MAGNTPPQMEYIMERKVYPPHPWITALPFHMFSMPKTGAAQGLPGVFHSFHNTYYYVYI